MPSFSTIRLLETYLPEENPNMSIEDYDEKLDGLVIDIVRRHFDSDNLPLWVNEQTFILYMQDRVKEEFYSVLETEDTLVDLTHILAFPLVSDFVNSNYMSEAMHDLPFVYYNAETLEPTDLEESEDESD